MALTKTQLNWDATVRSLTSMVREANHVGLFCHQNADPDAVCSAFVLEKLLSSLFPGVKVESCCPEGVSASTKQLLTNLGINIPGEKILEEPDLVVLVDTNTLDQLGKTGERLRALGGGIVVVDHHHPHPDTQRIARLMIVDESAAAAAEVVYQLARAAGKALERQEAAALLAALFVETKHFLLARESTFKVAGGLVEAGADPRHLSELLGSPMGRSERIARLKAAERSKVVTIGDWIIATSQLGSYQSSAARGFLGLGAHVSIVAGEAGEKVRANLRATESFAAKTGIHLARDLAIPLGKLLGGTGGGHSTAAGLTTSVGVEETLTACVDRMRVLLGPFQT